MNLPVEYQKQYLENISIDNKYFTCQNQKVLFNFKRRLQRSIVQYVAGNSDLEESYFARYANLMVENGENIHALGDLDQQPGNQRDQNGVMISPSLNSPE